MKKLIIHCLYVFLIFNFSGCSPSKEGEIMLGKSEKGMTFHGLKESKALGVEEVLKATFPELGTTKTVSIRLDNMEKAYYIVPEK